MENNAADLRDAAQQGSVDALYRLIHSDANVLDRIDDIPFVETPLHIAVSAGHTYFALEIMKLKPSFAQKLNKDGFTPVHLALQNKQTQLVLRLVDVDKELVRVKGRDNVTPLHSAAQLGKLDLLAKFLEVCPESIKDVTIRKETALHIALKYDMFDAFQLILKWLKQALFKDASLWEKKLLYWEDEEGNTLMHVAVTKNQTKVSPLHSSCLVKENKFTIIMEVYYVVQRGGSLGFNLQKLSAKCYISFRCVFALDANFFQIDLKDVSFNIV